MSKSENYEVKVQLSNENIKKSGEQLSQNRRKFNYEIWLKYVSLVVLVVQNAGQVLLIRHATTRHQEPFLKTVLVFFGEVLKCVAACILLVISHGSFKKALHDIRLHFIDNFLDTLKVGVPALIYTVQNFLLYVSIENLDAGTYMVTYQLKTLTTALFTVLMLKRRLSIVQWISLVILCGGVAIVQISARQGSSAAYKINHVSSMIAGNTTQLPILPTSVAMNSTTYALPASTISVEKKHKEQNPFIGLAAVITACFLSGFAGIYFEKILKGSDASLWLRNVQLAALSIPIGICMIAVSNGQDVLEKGLLQGFDVTVWLVVCVQAFGGLVVAVVIKYADNILKAFATSFAIVVSSIAAIFLFAHYPTILFCAGAAFVIISVVLYSVFPYKAVPYSSTNQSSEKQTAMKSPADATEESITGIEIVESNIQPEIENNDDSAKAH